MRSGSSRPSPRSLGGGHRSVLAVDDQRLAALADRTRSPGRPSRPLLDRRSDRRRVRRADRDAHTSVHVGLPVRRAGGQGRGSAGWGPAVEPGLRDRRCPRARPRRPDDHRTAPRRPRRRPPAVGGPRPLGRHGGRRHLQRQPERNRGRLGRLGVGGRWSAGGLAERAHDRHRRQSRPSTGRGHTWPRRAGSVASSTRTGVSARPWPNEPRTCWSWGAPIGGRCSPGPAPSTESGFRVRRVRHRDAAVAWVREHLGPGDAVLYENDLPDHYP